MLGWRQIFTEATKNSHKKNNLGIPTLLTQIHFFSFPFCLFPFVYSFENQKVLTD